ncbi:endonuclease 8-like 1 [Branchiostoma lanceolatum]|uniref:endonuclease 8-like 1 n=1 Tax=Branchiostoma lanceolatum TaxID=7740 RepID=UPI003454C972
MPEGPELHLASRFVNAMCAGRVFTGSPVKSEVNWKNPEVSFEAKAYTISAVSRGKEVQMSLNPVEEGKKKKGKVLESLKIVFRFGMSGMFRFTPASELPKHAHLMFHTTDKPPMVLSFVDVRRFGKWEVGGGWQKDRGPCIILEYQDFRANVLSRLSDAAFNRSICEVLLNQKYFNGVGNYLRAEVLYRLGIPPFVSARSVLEPLAKAEELVAQNGVKGVKVKTEQPDLLELCNKLALEVVSLGATTYNHSPDSESSHDAFLRWLQCYYNSDMRTLVDHNGRTIWFKGEAGPLAPKGGKTRGTNKKMEAAVKKRKSTNKVDQAETVKKVKVEVKTETSKGSKSKKTQKRNTRPKHPSTKVGTGTPKSTTVGRTRSKSAQAPAKNTQARPRRTTKATAKTPHQPLPKRASTRRVGQKSRK